MKKLLTFLLALTLLFSLFACNSTGEEDRQENGDSNQNGETAQTSGDLSRIDKIKQEGTLRIGTSADYPPYEFHTEIDGVDTIVGFDIALCQYIADDLGVELEITDMALDSRSSACSRTSLTSWLPACLPTRSVSRRRTSPIKFLNPSSPSSFARQTLHSTPPRAELAGASIGVPEGHHSGRHCRGHHRPRWSS